MCYCTLAAKYNGLHYLLASRWLTRPGYEISLKSCLGVEMGDYHQRY